MKTTIRVILASAVLCLTSPAQASEDLAVTSNHLFKKGEEFNLEPRKCENGRHPITVAHHADLAKMAEIKIILNEHLQTGKPSYFTSNVTEDTPGVVAQLCSPKNIKPYFDKLKAEAAAAK